MGNYSSGKLLCLDGGGVRGMIEARILEHIESQSERRIKDSFEWMAGTSTGALVALYLGLDHTATECMDLYKTLKNEIFGSKSYRDVVDSAKGVKNFSSDQIDRAVKYNCDKLETVLKSYFGENTKMCEIKNVKILITVTDGKQDPLKLIHFTNFDEKSKDELVWKVARATTAAPGYFTKFFIDQYGPLFDGGLTANNPTLTALSYIVDYYNKQELSFNLKKCVSLGTGLMPVIDTELPDLPTNAFDAFWKWKSGELETLLIMLSNEITRTDGHLISQAKAFCSVAKVKYIRLNPFISQLIDLNETNDDVLDQMIDETNDYINQNQNLFEDIYL